MSDTKNLTKLNTPIDYQFEPERYELTEPPRHRFGLERRDFFKFVGGGVAILVSASGKALAQQEAGGRPAAPAIPQEINAWLHVGENNTVTVFTGKVELVTTGGRRIALPDRKNRNGYGRYGSHPV